jgi:hypothetical protein
VFGNSIGITNSLAYHDLNRKNRLRQTFSPHIIFQAYSGQIIFLTETPDGLRKAAMSCQNVHTWTDLAGESGEKQLKLRLRQTDEKALFITVPARREEQVFYGASIKVQVSN